MSYSRTAAALAVLSTSLATAPARAQADYSNRPVKIIVTFAPGGPVDLVARRVGESLSRQMGQPVVVDNRPGANGIVGANACKNAVADGYTLCAFLSDTLTINPAAYKKLTYGVRDFAPVAELTKIDAAVVVSAAAPVRTMQELARYEAANPGKLSWGHFGVGSSSHLYMTQVNSRLGTQFVDIPYPGGGPTLNALLGGQVQASLLAYGLVAQHIDQGKLRALGVLGDAPSARFAGVPLLKDQGLGNLPPSWIGLFAPAGTPPAVVARLNREVRAVLREPELAKGLQAQGLTPAGGAAEEFDAVLKADTALWGAVVKAANVGLD